MVRAALLFGLGVGYLTLPHLVWLAAMALVVAASVGPGWWRRRPSDLVVRVEPTTRHAHYCGTCDRQWSHPGDSAACVEHWATPCPGCRRGDEPLPARVA